MLISTIPIEALLEGTSKRGGMAIHERVAVEPSDGGFRGFDPESGPGAFHPFCDAFAELAMCQERTDRKRPDCGHSFIR